MRDTFTKLPEGTEFILNFTRSGVAWIGEQCDFVRLGKNVRFPVRVDARYYPGHLSYRTVHVALATYSSQIFVKVCVPYCPCVSSRDRIRV